VDGEKNDKKEKKKKKEKKEKDLAEDTGDEEEDEDEDKHMVIEAETVEGAALDKSDQLVPAAVQDVAARPADESSAKHRQLQAIFSMLAQAISTASTAGIDRGLTQAKQAVEELRKLAVSSDALKLFVEPPDGERKYTAALVNAVEQGRNEIAVLLMESRRVFGSHVNGSRQRDGMTALRMAIKWQWALVPDLIRAGAEVDQQVMKLAEDEEGEAPPGSEYRPSWETMIVALRSRHS
jgi:hypothetical protein